MTELFENFWLTLFEFLIFFITAGVLTLLFVVIYTRITRHDEIGLIKKNSTAAAIAFSGSLIGFGLPLASIMITSISLIEMMLWGLIALAVQVLVYMLVRLPMPRISERIEANETAAGVWLGSCSLVAGMLNAASMTV